jgi:hypothetical protein
MKYLNNRQVAVCVINVDCELQGLWHKGLMVFNLNARLPRKIFFSVSDEFLCFDFQIKKLYWSLQKQCHIIKWTVL